jgi:hypothetical protein
MEIIKKLLKKKTGLLFKVSDNNTISIDKQSAINAYKKIMIKLGVKNGNSRL